MQWICLGQEKMSTLWKVQCWLLIAEQKECPCESCQFVYKFCINICSHHEKFLCPTRCNSAICGHPDYKAHRKTHSGQQGMNRAGEVEMLSLVCARTSRHLRLRFHTSPCRIQASRTSTTTCLSRSASPSEQPAKPTLRPWGPSKAVSSHLSRKYCSKMFKVWTRQAVSGLSACNVAKRLYLILKARCCCQNSSRTCFNCSACCWNCTQTAFLVHTWPCSHTCCCQCCGKGQAMSHPWCAYFRRMYRKERSR